MAGALDDREARIFLEPLVAGRALAQIEHRASYRFDLLRVQAVGAEADTRRIPRCLVVLSHVKREVGVNL